MRTCTTHHNACDCREAEYTTQMALLKAENARLREALERLLAKVGPALEANFPGDCGLCNLIDKACPLHAR